MSQKRSYKHYSREYKEEAVALVTEQGYSVLKAAESLGINPNMLYKWKDKLAAESQGKTLPESERDELKRLRRENKELRMEKAILKNRLHRIIAHLTRNTIMSFVRKVVVRLLEILIPSKNLTQGNLRTRCWWLDPV